LSINAESAVPFDFSETTRHAVSPAVRDNAERPAAVRPLCDGKLYVAFTDLIGRTRNWRMTKCHYCIT